VTISDEEQRYARAWAVRRRRSRIVAASVGVGFCCMLLAGACYAAGLRLLSTVFGLTVLGSFVIWAATVWYTELTFRCPRCGHVFSDWAGEKNHCLRCHFPLNAPRNPDPNWKPT
jgi:hypothetical protein